MPNLQATLRQLADNFAQSVLDVVHRTSLNDLHVEPLRRGPGRPRGTAARVAKTPRASANGKVVAHAAKKKAGRKPAAGAGAGADVLLDRLLDALNKAPQGLRSETLRSSLNMEKVAFRALAAAAVDAGVAKREGEKRATTFFAV